MNLPVRPNMVISRVPLRISFVGGGSDLPGGPGATISTAIDKYVIVMAKWRWDNRVIMNWREKEDVPLSSNLNHELARESLLLLGVHRGIEISTFADVPGVGSGLGSSSATTIGILQAVAALKGIPLDSSQLFTMACHVELERLERKGGRQDQLVQAKGGLVVAKYDNGNVADWDHYGLTPADRALLREHFTLYSPGEPSGRNADDVLGTFTRSEDDAKEFRETCVKLVKNFETALKYGNHACMGRLLGEHNDAKNQAFSGYWAPELAELTKLGIPSKICGAGGTGHLLAYSSMEGREATVAACQKAWGPELPWSPVEKGATIIYAD